ncbi:DUF4301 family protein [Flavobacterium sp. '19STA2R22 D10 B1']|uniref:DUF4301 family protein n=1 Tax=Flavobacterium aerium TaxID=3037261 RepID=UPI00278C7216|nr:DUF4301 family protein [Flavobacterium sp. '19STA2R22 D10 B1']
MEENIRQQSTNIIKVAFCGFNPLGRTHLLAQIELYFQDIKIFEAISEKGYEEIQASDLCIPDYIKKDKYDLVLLFQELDLDDRKKRLLEEIKTTFIDLKQPYILMSDEESSFDNIKKIIKRFNIAKQKGFSTPDYIQLYQYGVCVETIIKQIAIFKKGIAKTILEKPALVTDGIVGFTEEEFQEKADYFDLKKQDYKLLKFVPASGAASRMFKFLNEFLNEFKLEKETINAYINRKKDNALSLFLIGLEKFPFYKKVRKKVRKIYPEYNTWNRDKRRYHFIKVLLSEDYFDYANKPKGVLPFHRYDTQLVTPIEEHLKESIFYADTEKVAHIHFTISEIHQDKFYNVVQKVKKRIENELDLKFEIDYSYQNHATDTIAVNKDNEILKDEQGKFIFRPAGHGALIGNLNELDADVIFIKNIDNIIQNHVEKTAFYKKALAGVMIQLQEVIFSYLDLLENKNITEKQIDEIVHFIQDQLGVNIGTAFSKFTVENKRISLITMLNRPIRVCGMVINEGEPGGGPFWVKDNTGNISLQIVEASQFDIKNPTQSKIIEQSTHFNPVDLVCGIKNYKGEKFNLNDFIDHESGFIVQKNKNGKDLKAYELPGLWNGAMANWITVFVEVPLLTFNPVKTVNDLLKPAHQPE